METDRALQTYGHQEASGMGQHLEAKGKKKKGRVSALPGGSLWSVRSHWLGGLRLSHTALPHLSGGTGLSLNHFSGPESGHLIAILPFDFGNNESDKESGLQQSVFLRLITVCA